MALSRFDLVIYGATGYTGRWVVEEVAKLVSSKEVGLTWAVAGRNRAKLEDALSNVSTVTGLKLGNTPIIEADSSDQSSLVKMAQKSKVVINCVGPYQFYGEPVIKACISEGAHHVDISGEDKFLEEMQLKYNDAAREKNVYIIGACGFDSIPADLGSVYLMNQFKGDVNSVESYMLTGGKEAVLSRGASINTGTWLSFINILANDGEIGQIRKKLFQVKLPERKPKLAEKSMMSYSSDVNKWCFKLKSPDHAVMRRTQQLLYEKDSIRPAQFGTYLALPTMFHGIVLMSFGIMMFILTRFKFMIGILSRHPRLFSGGFFANADQEPRRETVEKVYFRFDIIARGWNEKLAESSDQHTELPDVKKTLRISGKNPGYGSCSVFLVQSALVILKEKDKMPLGGGVLPPGFAFRKTSLMERIKESGINVTLTES